LQWEKENGHRPSLKFFSAVKVTLYKFICVKKEKEKESEKNNFFNYGVII
jgi:hypothetical protein